MYDKELIPEQLSKEFIQEQPSKELINERPSDEFCPSKEIFSKEEKTPKMLTTSQGTSYSSVSETNPQSQDRPYWTPERIEVERKTIEEYTRSREEIEDQYFKEMMNEVYRRNQEEIANKWLERRRRKGKI